MARPVTNEDRKAVRRFHAQGKSLRAIAREIGRSPVTVGRIAKDAGLSFDTRPTESATRAKQQDNRARRAALIEWQYERALRLADRMAGETWETVTRTQQGAIIDRIGFVPSDDELALARAIGQYSKTAADLEKIDTSDGVDVAKSMLTDLFTRLGGK